MNARSPFVIGGLIVAVLAGLGVLMLARTGSGEPPAPAPVASPTPTPSIEEGTPTTAPSPDDVLGDESTTVLRVRVADCNGCQVTARASDATSGEHQWSATVADGVAQLELPTPNTLGMSFFLQGERDGEDTPLRSLVALMPNGASAGDPVSAARIEQAKRAGYCWAGTTLDVAVLNFAVQVQKGRVQQAWANPALPALPATVNLQALPKTQVNLNCRTAP